MQTIELGGEDFTARVRRAIDAGPAYGHYRISKGGLEVLIADAVQIVGDDYEPIPELRVMIAETEGPEVVVKDRWLRQLVIWSERLGEQHLAALPTKGKENG